MKKLIYGILAFTFFLVVALIVYGAYLNYSGENKISHMMEDHRLLLSGARAEVQNVQPVVHMDIVTLSTGARADAVSLIDGRVVELFVNVNDVVTEGQPVARVVNPDYSLQVKELESSLLEAEAKYQQAISDSERYQRLWEKEATSKEKMEAARTNLAAARANLEALQAKRDRLLLQESYQTILAPVSGKVLINYLAVGTHVKVGGAILLIGNNEELLFSESMRGEIAKCFDVGQEVSLKFNLEDLQKAYDTSFGVGNRGENQEIKARVVSVDPPLTEEASLRRGVFQVDNHSGILDMKSYRDVDISADVSHECLAVPRSAVNNSTDDEPYVFVLTGDDTLEQRRVQVGILNEKWAGIEAGLTEGEVVVTSTKQGLTPGLKVRVDVK